jgi:hypothetical protein
MFNLKEYIKDSSFKIHITNNNTYIDNYISIDTLNDNLIILIFDTFKLKIEGNNFIIKKLVDQELLFSGYINNINFELK